MTFAACGGAGVPTGGGTSTPIPIELPSATGNFSFPDSLGVGVGTVSSSSSSVRPPWGTKALSGSGAPERALSFVDDANDRLDTLLALLAEIEVENSTSTTSVTGTTVGGSSYRLDFAAFTFPAFSNQQVSTVDCSATCSGNAGELPMCARLYINNRRVFAGIFTALPDDSGQGAGCGRLFGTHNTRTTEDAQIRGVETYELGVVWDQQTSASHQLELYWATSLPDLTGFDVEISHAYLTETSGSSQSVSSEKTTADTVVQAAVVGTHADFGDEAEVEFTATWTPAADKLFATYTVEGESASQSCVTLAGTTTSGCTAQSLLAVPGSASSNDVTLASTIAASNGLVGVFGGNVTSYALDVDGTVYGWGNNYVSWAVDETVEYTLGVGEGRTNYTTPVELDISGVTQLGVGPLHAVARRSDGTVWTWGSNRSGQLGNGTTTYSPTPIQVTALSNILYVGAGDSHNIALRNDGTIWAWGDNGYGQLGDGTTTDRLTPVQIGSLSNVAFLAAGSFHNLALRSDGTVWGWGWSVNAEISPYDLNLPLESRTIATPTQIAGISDVVAIAAGNGVSLAVKRDGTLWVWGIFYCDSASEANTGPRQVTALSNIVDIGLGSNSAHALALDTSGRVYAWGENENGQLGDGTTTDRTYCSPTTVSGLERVISVSGGLRHSLALKNDGTVWAWGDPSSGQLGNGTGPGYQLPPQTTPVEVTDF